MKYVPIGKHKYDFTVFHFQIAFAYCVLQQDTMKIKSFIHRI